MMNLAVAISAEEARALVKLCQRLTYSDLRRLSGSVQEHDRMNTALIVLREAITSQGVNPR